MERSEMMREPDSQSLFQKGFLEQETNQWLPTKHLNRGWPLPMSLEDVPEESCSTPPQDG